MLQNWGLKKKFVVLFLVLITLPTVLFSLFIYYQTTIALKNQAIEDIVERLDKNEQHITSIITELESMTSYMIYDESFRTFFKTSQKDLSQIEYKNAIKSINGYFTFQLMSRDYISSVSLMGKDGNMITVGEPITEKGQISNETAIQGKGIPVWSDSYEVTSGWGGRKHIISLTRVINDLHHINEPIGGVRIRIDQSILFNDIKAKRPLQQGNYFVLSTRGDVVLHYDQSLVGKQYPNEELKDWVINGKDSAYSYKKDKSGYLSVKKKLEGTNWLSVAVVDEGELVKELYAVRASIKNMIVLLLVLGIIAFIGFYRSYIKRITELTRQTMQVEKGNFLASVDVKTRDEIGILGMQFNKMVKTIQKSIDIEYKLKIKQKESELKALQSQINPHFLYNTLDMIRWTARLENAMETGNLIEGLSKVFRMNLNNGKMWIPLEKEIEYIKAYLELQKSRLGDRLAFSIFIDNQVKEKFIMKQIIQPLVENCIKHGFNNYFKQGIINIRCYQVDNQLWIDVIDNGWGFQPTSGESTGYALKNLRDRLNIAFGEEYSLILLETKEGAAFRLVLPLLDGDNLKVLIKED
ncbi:histidine kinase [Sporosarcina sp. FSL K6-2383]|uniref:cache domain-containing sensor histidine kinase n=1 Tax=Sporosarcina sp. FSL K6-2383 TaxID=2921556 RepID=UPI00315A34AC